MHDQVVGVRRGRRWSWVTITTVWPSSRTHRRSSPRTSAPARLSRLPVGSSANMIVGRATQAAGDRDPLLLAARQLARAGGRAGRAGRARRPAGRTTPGRRAATAEVDRQQDVLPGGEHRQQVEGLEDEADVVAAEAGQRGVVQRGELAPGDDHRPGRRRVQPGQAVHQRGLARSGRAHDRGEPAGGDVQVDAVQGVHRRRAAAVGLGQCGRARGRDAVRLGRRRVTGGGLDVATRAWVPPGGRRDVPCHAREQPARDVGPRDGPGVRPGSQSAGRRTTQVAEPGATSPVS